MNQYAAFRKKQGEEVDAQTQLVKVLNDSLQTQKQLKDTLLSNEEDEKLKMESDKKSQEGLISQIKKRERKYRRQLKKKQDDEKKITANIDKLIREAIAKSNENTGTKTSETFSLTPEARALATRFEQNKGKLPWPTNNGFISEKFGTHAHPTISGVSVNNNGVNICNMSRNL